MTPLHDPTADDHRIHLAANDPGFPAMREAAVGLICVAIETVASASGYVRKGQSWARITPSGRTVIHLHRDAYGWFASIHLRLILPDGTAPEDGPWQGTGDIDLGQFYPPGSGQSAQLAYVDVAAQPALLASAMMILQSRALPWLDAHHLQAQPVWPT